MTPTTVDLLDSIRTHLAEFELPAMWSVYMAASLGGPNVTVQLPRREAPEIASALLAWADTLTGVTADVWRVPKGDSVHLSVTGALPGGVSIQVYCCVPFTEHGVGADLAPNATTTIPLAALRHLAALGEVTA
ncbi:MAG: hypothetical protein M3460_18480 [Actinomycetota bacterium]|nr:hypothetical protein [Actinomycetota bacterium]